MGESLFGVIWAAIRASNSLGDFLEKCDFGDGVARAPVLIGNVPPALWGAKNCGLCKSEEDAASGICIKCDAGMCRNFFHPTCAQKHGLLRVIEEEDCECVATPQSVDQFRIASQVLLETAAPWHALV